ncbi:MAG: 50S ribosomal protein L6 [Nanoarchaeota archaeon]
MKKNLSKKIEIPEGVEFKISNNIFSVKSGNEKLDEEFILGKLEIKEGDHAILLESNKSTKREKKMMNTIAAHIRNMIQGVQKKFEYKLKICYSHFPFTISISGNDAHIKNFLGEKVPRIIKIPKDVEVKIDNEIILVLSADKRLAGQFAASLERGTKTKNRDKRVFQDGIYITNKAGKQI